MTNPKSKIQNLKLALLCLFVCSSAASGQSIEVVVAGRPVRKTLTLTTTQPARMEALQRTPIHSKLAAYVAEVLVDYGDRVKQGQPLIKLLAPEIEAEAVQKQALLEQTRAGLKQAEAGVKAAEAAVATAASKVGQAEAGTARAQADIERWQSEFNRIQQLATSGAINRQLVDETQQKYKAAEALMKESLAAIDASKAAHAQTQAERARAGSDVEAAKARVRVAEAGVAQADAMRSYLTITAPFDGIVTERKVDPGHFVQPAGSTSQPLLVVTRSDIIRVFVAIPEMEAAYIDIGDPVALEIQSVRGAAIGGKVTRTGFALDPANRSLDTIIDLENDGRLRPGLYATAKITLDQRKDALTLPTAAVLRQGKDAFCFRLTNGKAAQTPIQLGLKVGDDFEVTNGLSDNDTVILNKAATLKDGQPVKATEPEAKK